MNEPRVDALTSFAYRACRTGSVSACADWTVCRELSFQYSCLHRLGVTESQDESQGQMRLFCLLVWWHFVGRLCDGVRGWMSSDATRYLRSATLPCALSSARVSSRTVYISEANDVLHEAHFRIAAFIVSREIRIFIRKVLQHARDTELLGHSHRHIKERNHPH